MSIIGWSPKAEAPDVQVLVFYQSQLLVTHGISCPAAPLSSPPPHYNSRKDVGTRVCSACSDSLSLSLRLRLPSGELLEYNFIDPREAELRELREMERRMAREAKEAEAKLAKGQKLHEEFIVAMEATYDGDEEG
ncbi:hypothetical protein RhiXN_11461 [Rhizoctonia solani]|uniref:Uncharacterized protein n=1 Tax=Rhizoctonia solani TaxID=456999 RepID=A0A8H8T0N7_9AGAM|nr:uncharacterized protein RhiXN_11461 [Rhizoctonia solani]QRW24549.1 hypothetical protein RhiXN_11461 [Rhizoctonia solani]